MAGSDWDVAGEAASPNSKPTPGFWALSAAQW